MRDADIPEKCNECGRQNVWRDYPAWQMRVCEECQSHEGNREREVARRTTALATAHREECAKGYTPVCTCPPARDTESEEKR